MGADDGPDNLASTFVVVNPDLTAAPVEVTPTLFERLDEDFDGFKGRCLVAIFDFDDDWPTWEIHPHGDEVVCLLSGDVEMVLGRDDTGDRVRLHTPGSFVLVPKGTWHTAKVGAPSSMLFITPGEGTINESV